MDWDSFQAFLAVARTGRTSAAARRLDVEHTTVSRRVAALEAELGVPLFYRTSTGYILTPHGHNALAQAETMERAALALAARAREDSGTIAGRVRVAMPSEFASHWLGPTQHARFGLGCDGGNRRRRATAICGSNVRRPSGSLRRCGGSRRVAITTS